MQYHNYIFLQTNSNKITTAEKNKFLQILNSDQTVIINGYSTLGLKVNCQILFWLQSDQLENIQDLINKLMHSQFGEKLQITYTLFGLTRPTQYSPKSSGHLETQRKGGKYLIIYPFTKTKEWYQLNFDQRKNLMWGHVQYGKKHPQIEQLLLYSYGVDDCEFIVSYETDDLLDFQTLVMELRSDKVRAYTLKDTPIFTCIYKSTKDVLDYL